MLCSEYDHFGLCKANFSVQYEDTSLNVMEIIQFWAVPPTIRGPQNHRQKYTDSLSDYCSLNEVNSELNDAQ